MFSLFFLFAWILIIIVLDYLNILIKNIPLLNSYVEQCIQYYYVMD